MSRYLDRHFLSASLPVRSPPPIPSPHFPVSETPNLHHTSLAAIVGAILIILGGLWLLQGTGLVVIEPIACVAECETLEGPSLQWALTGVAALAVGAGLVWFSLFRRRS